jgi:hypothetical protein
MAHDTIYYAQEVPMETPWDEIEEVDTERFYVEVSEADFVSPIYNGSLNHSVTPDEFRGLFGTKELSDDGKLLFITITKDDLKRRTEWLADKYEKVAQMQRNALANGEFSVSDYPSSKIVGKDLWNEHYALKRYLHPYAGGRIVLADEDGYQMILTVQQLEERAEDYYRYSKDSNPEPYQIAIATDFYGDYHS